MGIFDIFKKKNEPTYDVTDMRVGDLDKNFIFDYDLSSWMVTTVYEYDWGDNFFTKEFRIESDNDTAFLSVEIDDEISLSISKKERLTQIGVDLPTYIMANNEPPSKIDFQGKSYFLEEESPGYCNDWSNKKDNWVEFISWDYLDKSGEYILSIERWDERKFEASHGKVIKEFEISNIVPQKQDD